MEIPIGTICQENIVEIDREGIYTTVLLQIIVLRSDIWCLVIVVFPLVYYLINHVFKDEYLWILYRKF